MITYPDKPWQDGQTFEYTNEDNEWNVNTDENDRYINGYVNVNNFDMQAFMEVIGIPEDAVTFRYH